MVVVVIVIVIVIVIIVVVVVVVGVVVVVVVIVVVVVVVVAVVPEKSATPPSERLSCASQKTRSSTSGTCEASGLRKHPKGPGGGSAVSEATGEQVARPRRSSGPPYVKLPNRVKKLQTHESIPSSPSESEITETWWFVFCLHLKTPPTYRFIHCRDQHRGDGRRVGQKTQHLTACWGQVVWHSTVQCHALGPFQVFANLWNFPQNLLQSCRDKRTPIKNFNMHACEAVP